jgi:hypothetical protein
MRLVSGLALAATAAIVFLACGETQEVTQSESPGVTASATPTASPIPTTAPASPTPTATYEWVPPTPEVSRDDLGPNWYVSAFEDDEAKAKITQQTLNGILLGPDAGLVPEPKGCADDPDGPAPVSPKDIEALVTGSLVDIEPFYLPRGVTVTMSEAAECQGIAVKLTEWYAVESRPDPEGSGVPRWAGGGFTISRTLTNQKQAFVNGVAERLHPATISGRPAIVVEPLTPRGYDIGLGSARIVIADVDTMIAIEGDGMPFGELLLIAESIIGV